MEILKYILLEWKLRLKESNEGDAFVTVLRERLNKARKVKYGKSGKISPMDEIKKAKELLDAGAITEEEFENIKKKYL